MLEYVSPQRNAKIEGVDDHKDIPTINGKEDRNHVAESTREARLPSRTVILEFGLQETPNTHVRSQTSTGPGL